MIIVHATSRLLLSYNCVTIIVRLTTCPKLQHKRQHWHYCGPYYVQLSRYYPTCGKFNFSTLIVHEAAPCLFHTTNKNSRGIESGFVDSLLLFNISLPRFEEIVLELVHTVTMTTTEAGFDLINNNNILILTIPGDQVYMALNLAEYPMFFLRSILYLNSLLGL